MQIITDGKDAATGAGQVGRLSTYLQTRPPRAYCSSLGGESYACVQCAQERPHLRWARTVQSVCGELICYGWNDNLRYCARRRRILAMDVRIPPPSSAYPRRAHLLDFASTQAFPVTEMHLRIRPPPHPRALIQFCIQDISRSLHSPKAIRLKSIRPNNNTDLSSNNMRHNPIPSRLQSNIAPIGIHQPSKNSASSES
ncbi:hypothetical protein B0H13DRAFT_2659778 [Mycena leptocephala]|nr:hypothetical protein B0H13DRAFT_2659778 [Mycena leptocephala]